MSIDLCLKEYFIAKSINLNELQSSLLNELDDFIKSIKNSRSIFKPKANFLGIYIYGTVGTGKTTLMDGAFFLANDKKSYRIHFSAFMMEIHDRLFALNSKSSVKDSLAIVADDLAKKYRIIFLDELEINDIADAMIVGRLFEKLFNLGVNFIITSNKSPCDLYQNGLQREYFLSFIDLIKKKLKIFQLSSEDYRLTKIANHDQRYFFPLNRKNDDEILNIINSYAPCDNFQAKEIDGTTLRSCYKDILQCDFEDLCAKPLAGAFYHKVATEFKIIFLLNIPKLSKYNRNEAKRFTILIDILYEYKVTLYCSAQAPIDLLYEEGDGAFEFKRTISRLKEMQSRDYSSE